MPFDTLYGAGSFAALTTLVQGTLPSAILTQSDTPYGVYVTIAWTDAIGPEICRIDCRGSTVHFDYLSTTCNANPVKRESAAHTTYKWICNNLVPALRSHGVTIVTASPFDSTSTTTLLTGAGGFTQDPVTGLLTWVL